MSCAERGEGRIEWDERKSVSSRFYCLIEERMWSRMKMRIPMRATDECRHSKFGRVLQ